MNKLLGNFPVPDFSDWKAKLLSDLKGQSADLIRRSDELEDIQYDCYQHPDSINWTHEVPGSGSHVRGALKDDNSWINYATVRLTTEQEANAHALKLLNMGADGLRFDLGTVTPHPEILLKDIQLAYIHTTFVIQTAEQFHRISAFTGNIDSNAIAFELDGLEILQDVTAVEHIAQHLKKTPQLCFVANGAAIQQCGANCAQEIAYCLVSAHEYLVRLMHHGLTVDEAAACIHFTVGTGGNYFYEISKIRALKQLWASVVAHYEPESTRSREAHITGLTGFINKSLVDPHTNLLRLTTEAMSLIAGGVDGLSILPYDFHAETPGSTLSERMALNISGILREESYFDKVLDPLGGSYTVTHLTHLLAEQSWSLFQQWDTAGGLLSDVCQSLIRKAVLEKAALRIQRMNEKQDVFIGINIFPNPKAETTTWATIPDYLGMPALILENKLEA